MFAKLMERYKDTGEDIYFDIQIKNEDPTSEVGSQIVILRGCNLNGGTLVKFDADAEYLDSSVDFTFEDYSIVKEFNNLNGML